MLIEAWSRYSESLRRVAVSNSPKEKEKRCQHAWDRVWKRQSVHHACRNTRGDPHRTRSSFTGFFQITTHLFICFNQLTLLCDILFFFFFVAQVLNLGLVLARLALCFVTFLMTTSGGAHFFTLPCLFKTRNSTFHFSCIFWQWHTQSFANLKQKQKTNLCSLNCVWEAELGL